MAKKRGTSPTQRALATLRAEGYTAEVVEKRLPRCFITKDLYGCIDVLGIRAGEPPLGVQVTSGANAAARMTKALAIPDLRTWLSAGGCRFEVWSFRLAGADGRRKTWALRRQPVTLADLPSVVAQDAVESDAGGQSGKAIEAPHAAKIGAAPAAE